VRNVDGNTNPGMKVFPTFIRKSMIFVAISNVTEIFFALLTTWLLVMMGPLLLKTNPESTSVVVSPRRDIFETEMRTTSSDCSNNSVTERISMMFVVQILIPLKEIEVILCRDLIN